VAEPADPQLPRGIALSWGIAERPQRAPKRELSLEGIVETAIEIADAEGLPAVSMSRVATTLGFTTMSLYRYITSKDELVLLMQNAAAEIPIPPLDEAQGWRDGLREWAARIGDSYRAHPWLLDIPINGLPMMPSDLAMVDWAMRIMRDLPLSQTEKMSTLLLVSGYARSIGQLLRDLTRAGQGFDDEGSEYGSVLRELVSEERFPYLYPVVQSGVYAGEVQGEDDPAFGLERILDGIEHYIAEAGAGHRSPSLGSPPEPYPADKAVREAVKLRREAEKRLREALKREAELVKNARERERNRTEAAARRDTRAR